MQTLLSQPVSPLPHEIFEAPGVRSETEEGWLVRESGITACNPRRMHPEGTSLHVPMTNTS